MLSHFPPTLRFKYDKWIRILVKEESEGKNQATHRSNNSVLRRNLELRISTNISSLWTGDHIECIGGMPVTVTLVDSQTNEEVNTGPEAFGKVEIVVIKAEAEDGRNEFECKLVSHNGGKKNVYVTKFPLRLLEGTVDLPKIWFMRERASMNMSNLRLQARFVDNFDGVHVKDAHTEPFLIKDIRDKDNRKHPIPSLDDGVWRLNKIDRQGPIKGRLINAGIKTVEDFIVHLFLRRQCLEEVTLIL
ncbi:calmodulin-binding protein 60 A-like [Bidens hawaiensis]|uniref:calmodulin-binding protein 60 A-like n=1 Tax=Bidens hawaiensis TaxID=980011 RepID=UPI00404AE8D3